MKAVRLSHDPDRFHQGFEIKKRFARSHADQIRPARRFHTGAVGIVQGDDNLFDDFACRQISQQAKLRSQTKRALQRATRLRRKANRVAAFFGNKDGLDGKPVVRLHQVAPGAVS